MPFQLVGINWLALLHRHNLSGVLADGARASHSSSSRLIGCIGCGTEMGLGKTVQIVALLSYLHASGAEGGEGPHLVIAPGSTLDQWQQCFEHWYPSLSMSSKIERCSLEIG